MIRHGIGQYVRYTDVVSRRDVGYSQAVRFCPIIFQAYVPKQVELRVTVVGDRVFISETYGAQGVLLDLLADGSAKPAWESPALGTHFMTAIAKDGLWLLAVDCIAVIVAMGVSSLIGSRGISIGVLLAWQLAVTPLILNISQLGVTRELLLSAAATRIQPFPGGDRNAVSMSLGAAIAVLVLWMGVPLLLGGWRTVTREA